MSNNNLYRSMKILPVAVPTLLMHRLEKMGAVKDGTVDIVRMFDLNITRMEYMISKQRTWLIVQSIVILALVITLVVRS